MRFSAVILFLVFATNMLAQPVRFSNFYDVKGAGGFMDMEVVQPIGLVTVGSALNVETNQGFYEGRTFSVDLLGTQLTSAQLNIAGGNLYAQSVLQSQYYDHFYGVGYMCQTDTTFEENCDFYFSRINPITYDTIISTVIGSPDSTEVLTCAVETGPNNILLAGWTFSDSSYTTTDLLFITVDSVGNQKNRVQFGGDNADFVQFGCNYDQNGNAIFTGYTQSFGTVSTRTWVVQTDSVGNVAWHREYDGLSQLLDGGTCITLLADGNFVLAGKGHDPGDSYAFLLKFDPLGNMMWAERYSPQNQQTLHRVIELPDGNFVAVGELSDNEDGLAGWLLKTDQNGLKVWSREYNPSFGNDVLRDVEQLDNGDFIMVGAGNGLAPDLQDGWVIRVDSLGCLVEGCDEPSSVQNHNMDFFRFYPNPAKDRITIESRVPFAHLHLLDITGRMLRNFELGEAQKFQANITLDYLPSGIYLLEVLTGQGQRSVRKVVLE